MSKAYYTSVAVCWVSSNKNVLHTYMRHSHHLVMSQQGNPYWIVLDGEEAATNADNALVFEDVSEAKSFVRSMRVPFGYWRRLLQNNVLVSERQRLSADIDETISQLLVDAKIRVFERRQVDTSTKSTASSRRLNLVSS